MSFPKSRLIGLHCSAKGFGYAVFEGTAIYDWGTVVARDDKNEMSLRKLARILDRYSPETMVLEDIEQSSARAERIRHLYVAIAALCATRGIDLHRYAQSDVRQTFRLPETGTRQDVAEAVVLHTDVLAPRLPPARKAWQSEARRMTIFSAAAVALTHLVKYQDFGI